MKEENMTRYLQLKLFLSAPRNSISSNTNKKFIINITIINPAN